MQSLTARLNANIWKYAVLLISNKRIFVAILGAYYLTVPGVTPEGIGVILLVASFSGFLFEIPSGYLSDKLGHKPTLILSRIFMLFSTLGFILADSQNGLIVAAVFMSLSQAFHSGTGSAFMHETLKGLGREEEYAQVMGKVSAIGFAVPVVFMVLTPFLVGVSYKAPFLLSLVVDASGLIVALLLTVPPVTPLHVEEIGNTNFLQVMREGWRFGFFRYALFFGLTSGVLFAVGGFRAAYQVFLEVPVIYFGIFFGIGRALASLLLLYSGRMKKTLSRGVYCGVGLAGYAVGILFLGLSSTTWVIVVVFIIINAYQWGMSQVNTGFMLDVITESKFKATLLSVRAQVDELVAALASYGLGLAIGYFSYRTGFMLLALGYLLLAVPVYIYILRGERSRPKVENVQV